jgi:hypothetical protein
MVTPFRCVTSEGGASGILARPMQAPPRSSFQPVEAGAVLASTVGVCGGAGALVGWGAGHVGYGVLGGVCVGIPAGVFAVYRRFKGYFS